MEKAQEIVLVETELKKILQSDDVKQYIFITNKIKKLEDDIKKEAADKNIKISYFSVIDNIDVEIVPAVRTTYKPSIESTRDAFGDEFITEAVDLKKMKEDPKCKVFLEKNKTETKYATRRIKK